MQRCRGKLSLSALSAFRSFSTSSNSPIPLHSSPWAFLVNRSKSSPIFSLPSVAGDARLPDFGFFHSPLFLCTVNQWRGFASIKKERRRTPITPGTSKLKKFKIKCYSSFKYRFRTMNDGQVRRWRAGKRHNAHLKSKKAKRRLRKPEIVHPAYARVMKKLHFCG